MQRVSLASRNILFSRKMSKGGEIKLTKKCFCKERWFY